MTAVVNLDYHINMTGHVIGELGEPSAASEATPKSYVDAAIAALRAEMLAAIEAALPPG